MVVGHNKQLVFVPMVLRRLSFTRSSLRSTAEQ